MLCLGGANSYAACESCNSFGQTVSWGTININPLQEASGIASSSRNPGVLWVHNDGARDRIYAVSTNGALLGSFNLNRDVDDLEDSAVGPGPIRGLSYLYVGDIGGNVGASVSRDRVQIIRIPEPAISLTSASDPKSTDFEGAEGFTLIYPDGSFDAEALLVDPLTSDVLVVTKQQGGARVYRANLGALPAESAVTMQFVRAVSFESVSGGDISADGTQIILRREESAGIWSRCDSEPISAALSRQRVSIPIVGPPTEPNGEGIALLREGTGYVTISEGENPTIYFFPALCPTAPKWIQGMLDQTVFSGGSAQFTVYAAGFPAPTFRWSFNGNILEGQTGSTLVLSNVTEVNAGRYEVTASNASGAVTSAANLVVRAKPNLRITEVQSSTAAGASVDTADWWELTSFESQPVELSNWKFNDSSGELDDAFVFGNGLVIRPGESIILVEGLSPAQFRQWWGEGNVPTSVQVITYEGAGLSLGAGGDELRLWNDLATDPGDTIERVEFGAAENGVSFNFNPETRQFGEKSQLGVNGVFRASASSDIGSPGSVQVPAVSPELSVEVTGTKIRVGFDAVSGRRYRLEGRNSLGSGSWTSTGDILQATATARMFFEKERSAAQQYYRIAVE